MVIFGRNRLRLRQRAPFPWTSSRRLSVLSAQVLKNAGRLRCPDPSSLLSINSSGCSRASFGGWPTFRFLKGWLPRAYPAWDLWILRMLARSCISVGTGEDEKEARRCMSPRLPAFAKNKGAKVGQPASLDFIHGLPGTLHLTFEEGTHSAWLYDLLARRVARVVVCNPRQNALLKAGNKSDTSDARKLAELLRAGLLAAVYQGEGGSGTLQELVRRYAAPTEDT